MVKNVDLYFDDLRENIIASMDLTKETSDDELREIIDNSISNEKRLLSMSIMDKIKLKNSIYGSIRGLDVLEEVINDKNITEIMINGPDNIFIEKNGQITPYPAKFSSKQKLLDVIQQIVGSSNRRVNESSPIVDTRLSNGSRVNIVLNPVAINGPIVTIRKFPDRKITMEKLIEYGSVTREVARFLEKLVKAKYNIFICGGTGSGKTTFLNALSNYIPTNERIITIEDSAELQIQGINNIVRMEARQENSEGENAITIRDLIKSSLRMRPDRIIVGEVRGEEAIDMLNVMNTGHDGSLSTGHGNNTYDMLSRLETMVLMGVDIPIAAVRGQIAAGIDILIHLSRLRDNSRRVLEISEVETIRGEKIVLNKLFEFNEIKSNSSKSNVKGDLKWCGNGLCNTQKLINGGFFSEAEKYGKSNRL